MCAVIETALNDPNCAGIVMQANFADAYGQPGAERRRDARLRTVLSGMIWGVLQTGYWLLDPAAEEQHRVYLNVMPKGLLWLLLRPVTLLVFGWFLM